MPTESYRQGCSSRGSHSSPASAAERDQGPTRGRRHSTRSTKKQLPRDKSGIQCFNCKRFGHYWTGCTRPQKVGAAEVAGANDVSRSVVPTLWVDCAAQPCTPHCTMEVNGVEATGIRDTGAIIILVAARLIREEDRTVRTSLITLADANHSIGCPTALLNLLSPFA